MPEDVGFATYFTRLYEQRLYTDVDISLRMYTITGSPVTFSAHKMVLSLWSPVFADEFYHDKEQRETNILQYSDVDSEAFEAMLRFMYGCNSPLQDHKKACGLYKVAIKFQVNSLQETCRRFLNELKVTPSNVFDILDASNFMENRSRTDTCLKLIQENTKEVMETFDLSGISSSMLNFFLNLPKMSLPGEYDLLVWVFSWAKNTCVDSNQYSNVREVLEPFLPKLNFLALTNKEFVKLRSQWPSFFTTQESIKIFMNIGERGSEKMPEWYDENRPLRIYNESKTCVKTETPQD